MTTQDPQINGTVREGFGSREITTTSEANTHALVAAAQAAVNARFIVALQRPRSWDDVLVRLLKECDRPGFAEAARYLKPIGKGIEGPSIRFAEACLRYAGNLDAETTTTFEDRFVRRLHVRVIDFETNGSYSQDISIEKTVERRDTKDRVVVAERKNSKGQTTYIVEATEDELLNKVNALVSKAVRTLVLRHIPGDIVEEGQQRCAQTLANKDAKDPAAAKKRLLEAFGAVGVMPKDIEAYVGHSLDAFQPAELAELRKVFVTIRDGESTWAMHLEVKRGGKEGAKAAPGTTADLEDKLRSQPTPAAKEPAPRDFAAEAEQLKAAISEAVGGTKKAKDAVRERFEKFRAEAPQDVVEDVMRHYTAAQAAKKAEKPKEEPATHDGREPPADWTPGAERQPGED